MSWFEVIRLNNRIFSSGGCALIVYSAELCVFCQTFLFQPPVLYVCVCVCVFVGLCPGEQCVRGWMRSLNGLPGSPLDRWHHRKTGALLSGQFTATAVMFVWHCCYSYQINQHFNSQSFMFKGALCSSFWSEEKDLHWLWHRMESNVFGDLISQILTPRCGEHLNIYWMDLQ